MIQLSFPGLGIEEFTLNPVAISFGAGFAVHWYAIFIIVGFALAFLYAWYRSRHEGIKFYDLLDTTLYTVIFSIIGARLFYVIMAHDQFNGFLDVIAIWDGGLAMYGAIIAGAITVAIVGKIKKLSILKIFDLAAPSLMLGQAVGCWGTFFNGESYGILLPEDNPLYFIRMGIAPHVFEDVRGLAFVHPTFLYEFIWLAIGFAVIHFIYKKKKFDGQIILMYLAWYGFGKMFIEAIRVDSLTLGVFRVSQVIGFICFVACTVALIYNLARSYRKEKDLEEYVPSYKKISNPASLFISNDSEDEEYTTAFKFSSDNEEEEDESTEKED
ncbi:MAG: prolipoprotein diacylglyceryl transferase [Clostridia bacterium]|nr:prolipoprotein diacylglyceryl transferase [Clostridia bacterium]